MAPRPHVSLNRDARAVHVVEEGQEDRLETGDAGRQHELGRVDLL
jgi:hypothetical protein